MKKICFIIITLFCFSCGKDNPLDDYIGTYNGEKIVIVAYREYDSVTHQYISKDRFDTISCKFDVDANNEYLDFEEFNVNYFTKYWHLVDVNNIGELAYLNPDTAGYGKITVDSLLFNLTFPYPYPPDNILETADTLFYYYDYKLKRE